MDVGDGKGVGGWGLECVAEKSPAHATVTRTGANLLIATRICTQMTV